MSKTIENLKWRYATKQYDSSKRISESDLGTIKQAVQLSASSYGLQPYKVLVITDPEIREKLKPESWGQSQITDASHLCFVVIQKSRMKTLIIWCNLPLKNGD